MIFLNPAFLWFAAAVAVPILVHLFNFRRPRRVLFSNLAFVREVHQTVQRRIKLKQWLLLLLRILAILALVFAFAEPVLRQDEENRIAALPTAKSILVVVDNSWSMTGQDDRGQYLEQARELTREIIRSYEPSDEFQILTTGRLRLNGAFYPAGQAQERAAEIDFDDRVMGLGGLVANLPYCIEEAKNPRRIVYFLSDFQRSTVLADTVKELNLPQDLEMYFLPVGNREQVNVYISEISLGQPLLEPGKPVTLNLRVNNDSDKELKNLSVNVTVDGKAMALTSLDLKPNQSEKTQVTFTPAKGGWLSGSVTLDDNPIDFDNTRYFSLHIPIDTRILIVQGEDRAPYLDLLYRNLVKQYRTETISDRDWARISPADYSTIVLSGVNELSEGVRDKLAAWVRDGGGLLVFPSQNMKPEPVNALLQQLGAGSYGRIVDYPQPVRFRTPDLGHPLFQGVFSRTPANAEFDSPDIRRLYEFMPATGGVQSTIISDAAGRAILHDTRTEGGRVFSFALAPDLTWSDFPIKSSFVPIVYRATLLVNNAGEQVLSRRMGGGDLVRIRTSSGETARLRGTDNYELIPEQYGRPGQLLLKFDRAEMRAGNYRIYQKDSLLEHISFNYPDEESQLARPDAAELPEILKSKQLGFVKVVSATPEQVRRDIQTSQLGQPLWKYFLVLCLLFLLGEVLVLRAIRG